MKNHKAVQQYLARYAEPEVALLERCLNDVRDGETRLESVLFPCQFGLVIPCYNESSAFLSALIAQFSQQSVCLVLVINQPDSQDNTEPQHALLRWITQHTQPVAEQAHLAFFRLEKLCLLVVNRFEGVLRIPVKQGVGLARKIGADLLAALWARDLIACSFLGSTDADARLPADYFSVLQQLSDEKTSGKNTGQNTGKNTVVAGVFTFKHGLTAAKSVSENDMAILQATKLYEQWLNYYVSGLRFAGSRYAFHTIGSCLAFSGDAYCQVRGFPTRAGGEDFYLLNKLAKLGLVKSLPAQIALQARVSARVPFGTGPAVKKLLEEKTCETTFEVYSPQVFAMLASLLAAFAHLWLARDNPDAWFEQLPKEAQQVLTQLGWQNTIQKMLPQCRSREQLSNQVQGWFDGFRTLRFIHLLERLYFFPVSLHEARKSADFSF